VYVHGFLVDAVWRNRRIVVELDGYDSHRTRTAFEEDRKRDTALQLAGYVVLRITYQRLTKEPNLVVAEIRWALDRV
jgi:very-short-patch-repair endonuclease